MQLLTILVGIAVLALGLYAGRDKLSEKAKGGFKSYFLEGPAWLILAVVGLGVFLLGATWPFNGDDVSQGPTTTIQPSTSTEPTSTSAATSAATSTTTSSDTATTSSSTESPTTTTEADLIDELEFTALADIGEIRYQPRAAEPDRPVIFDSFDGWRTAWTVIDSDLVRISPNSGGIDHRQPAADSNAPLLPIGNPFLADSGVWVAAGNQLVGVKRGLAEERFTLDSTGNLGLSYFVTDPTGPSALFVETINGFMHVVSLDDGSVGPQIELPESPFYRGITDDNGLVWLISGGVGVADGRLLGIDAADGSTVFDMDMSLLMGSESSVFDLDVYERRVWLHINDRIMLLDPAASNPLVVEHRFDGWRPSDWRRRTASVVGDQLWVATASSFRVFDAMTGDPLGVVPTGPAGPATAMAGLGYFATLDGRLVAVSLDSLEMAASGEIPRPVFEAIGFPTHQPVEGAGSLWFIGAETLLRIDRP